MKAAEVLADVKIINEFVNEHRPVEPIDIETVKDSHKRRVAFILDELIPKVKACLPSVPTTHHASILDAAGHLAAVARRIQDTCCGRVVRGEAFDGLGRRRRADVNRIADSVRVLDDIGRVVTRAGPGATFQEGRGRSMTCW